MGTIPNKALGYGVGSSDQKMLAFYTSANLSGAVKAYLYDNNQTFPALESTPLTTTNNECFTGTTKNGSTPMYGLIDTTDTAPTYGTWWPISATAGAAAVNLMNGSTSYVQQQAGASNPLSAGERFTFNMGVLIPSDTVPASVDMRAEITFSYPYTGSTPSVKMQYNDPGTGTEGTPDWTDMTAGTHGLRHGDSGSSAGSVTASIPQLGETQAIASDTNTLSDLTVSGTHTNSNTAAIIEVQVTATGTPDTFQWRKTNVGSTPGSFTTGVSITGSAQSLADGLSITFGATTGHAVNDRWLIFCDCRVSLEGWIEAS